MPERISMILIIDFGSQYNQLIARRVRECRVYCQIESPEVDIDYIKNLKPEGIILSGGPSSIYEKGSPKVDPAILSIGIPVLGICYDKELGVLRSRVGKVPCDRQIHHVIAICWIKHTCDLSYVVLFKNYPVAFF